MDRIHLVLLLGFGVRCFFNVMLKVRRVARGNIFGINYPGYAMARRPAIPQNSYRREVQQRAPSVHSKGASIILHRTHLLLNWRQYSFSSCVKRDSSADLLSATTMAARVLQRQPFFAQSNFRKSAFLTPTKMAHSERTFSSYFVTPAELSKSLKSNAPSRLSTAPKTIPVCGSWFL